MYVHGVSDHSNRTRVCALLHQSGQRWIVARDGLPDNPKTDIRRGLHLER
jgi:hypothetical protein